MTFMELFETENAFNTYKYSGERYDELVSGARKELGEDRRMNMMLEAERVLISEDAGCAPMFFQGAARLQKPFVTRFVRQPYGGGRDVSLWRVKG